MPADVSSIHAFREGLGVTQQELGDRVGVTRQTIAAWEKGERSMTVAQLVRLAKALGVSAELLLGDQESSEATLLFRADDPAVLTLELRDLMSAKVEDYVAVELLVGEPSALPESRPLGGFDADLIEEAAAGARDWLRVDDAPMGDVLALLEAKGLKVLPERLPRAVSGFSAYSDEWGGVIVINEGHALERQYFTALHELAHLIFHRGDYDGREQPVKRRADPREKTANHFASAVLLPRGAMKKELRGLDLGWIPTPVLEAMKFKYGVSMRTVLLRAGALGLISQKQAGQQVGALNKRFGAHYEEPQLPKPDWTPQRRLERLTYRALIMEKVTVSRAAEVLGRPLSVVRRQLAAYLTNPAAEQVAP